MLRRSMIEIVKEPEWLPTTCVDHRFTTHPLTETTHARARPILCRESTTLFIWRRRRAHVRFCVVSRLPFLFGEGVVFVGLLVSCSF